MIDGSIEFEGHRSLPSMRDIQRHTYLDVDDWEKEDLWQEQHELDLLGADNLQITALIENDKKVLDLSKLEAEAAEEVIEEAEAIVQNHAKLIDTIGSVAVGTSRLEIFNSSEKPEGRIGGRRWDNVDPSFRPTPPAFRGQGGKPKSQAPPLSAHRDSRKSWHQPIIQPSRPPENDDPIIDLRFDKPEVIPPKPLNLDLLPSPVSEVAIPEKKTKLKTKKKFMGGVVNRIKGFIDSHRKPEKESHPNRKRRIGIAVGAVAVVAVAAGSLVYATRGNSEASSVNEALASRAPVTSVYHAPETTTSTRFSPTRNAQYREFYKVDHDLSEEEMNQLDAAFHEMAANPTAFQELLNQG